MRPRASVRNIEDVPLGECLYHVFTRMPGESFRRRLRSLLLCLCDVFRALIISLMCRFPQKNRPAMFSAVCLRCSSSSNWILMSCQPHRITPRQSNSCHKQIHISKLFSHIYQTQVISKYTFLNSSHIYIYQPSVKSVYKNNHFAT